MELSERLRDATVSITLDTYSHAIPAMRGEAAVLIAGLLRAGNRSALLAARQRSSTSASSCAA